MNAPSQLHDHDAARWDAVSERAAHADGNFFYAVRTTGVFCRPTCPARRPRRENVEFFDTVALAQLAGYRPCKRCRPEMSPSRTPRTTAIVEACRLLSSNAAARTRDVASAVGLSDSYFQRTFKKELGVTPQQYRRRILAQRGRDTLSRTNSVTEAVYRAGYSSSSRFYEGVGRELGMKPSTARLRGEGQAIRYTVAVCSLGHVLVGWTAQGVCEVALGDSREALVSQLATRFSGAYLEESAETDWTRAVIEAVEMPTTADIPLDIQGTAFQERVWRELRRIPLGETRTYAEVAAALGKPDGARAVARACAANPIAIVVPCHRVVRKDGKPSGYRWGLARKRKLLAREQS
ncbi:MAG: bifunctional DNA-binding transcriptional regulator/O6-methylguanine-DNA methyltransferase Ada [Myxococcota bacterium]